VGCINFCDARVGKETSAEMDLGELEIASGQLERAGITDGERERTSVGLDGSAAERNASPLK